MIRFLRTVILTAMLLPALASAHGGHGFGLAADPDLENPSTLVVRDGAGRLLRVEVDTNGDEAVDVWSFYSAGQLARQEQDSNFDGAVDVWLDIDELGQPSTGRMDSDHDGAVDVIAEFSVGGPTLQRRDTDADGLYDELLRFTDGQPVSLERDTDADGRADRWVFFDARGQSVLILADLDRDGFPDQRRGMDQPSEQPAKQPETEPVEPVAPSDVLLEEVVVSERRPLTSFSDQQVRDRDFCSFPHQNPSDIVRLIPGVHVSQHTGGAKAYQYFLRGFDAEHGQDLAAYLDGIPLNEPSQVHGHGYLDLHFLIPETIAAIHIIKGPYDPEFGNFATAGAIDFKPRRSADHSSIGSTAGMYGTAKVLGTFGLSYDPYLASAAVQTEHTDGFTDPGWADALRGNQSHTALLGPWTLNLQSHHYGQRSAATDVIPDELIESGVVDRYGSLDESDRISSNRHLVGLTADYQLGLSELRLQPWYDYKRTTIWSNYTFYFYNPERGDQQEMYDQRNVVGLNARYSRLDQWGPTLWQTGVGVQWRMDMVRNVLANTVERERFNVINSLDFRENALGVWLREDLALTDWLRIVPGARFDLIGYSGEGTQDERYFNIYTNMADTRQDVERDWDEYSYAISPKASLIVTPLRDWSIFVNYGEGFFSNTTGQMANEPQREIPKVRGGEVGSRVGLWQRRISVALAAWFANKEQDLIFDPLTGLSMTKNETERRGLEAELRLSPLNWLYLATDFAWVDARYAETGERITNGPITLMTNGLGWSHPLGLRGMLRGRYMGPRELDGEHWVDPYYVLDLVAGYDTPRWGLELAVDNLLDAQWEDAVFYYTTRPEPNGEDLTGLHFTPGTPLLARFTVTAKF
ncbi:MAG: TonB-dependent receptor [Candidatus Alcyoniella australis]|nr:TonB-dependent receptor [Candidatus Alcyoniella australis]